MAQVSNMGNIEVTCYVPARPFPTNPGERMNGLQVRTVAEQISATGEKKAVESEAHKFGDGESGYESGDREWVQFLVHLPLEPAERDEEARRLIAKLKSTMPDLAWTEADDKRAMERLRDLVYQHRIGHFQIKCRVVDGDRVVGTGEIEVEVLFKGRFSDVGLPGAPPV